MSDTTNNTINTLDEETTRCGIDGNDTKALGTAPILKLIAKYSIPSVIASLINAIYNIVDRLFLARYEPEYALGGLQAGFPIMLFMMGVGLLCSIGFSTLASIHLGQKDTAGANRIYVSGLETTLLCTALLTLFGALFIKPLLNFTGASENTLPYAQDYMLIIVYAQFFQMISLYLANFARIEGHPYLSMASQVVAGVVNIILDFVFIGPLHMGVKGAAYATIIGLGVGMMILIVFYFFTKKSMFHIRLHDLKPDFRLIGSALAIGLSSFMLQIGNVVSNVVMNNVLLDYGGDQAIIALSAIASIFTIVFMPLIGIKDGVVPIIGYNYGAGKIDRAKKSLIYAIVIGVIFSTAVWIFMESAPQVLLSLFFKADSETMPIAKLGMRINFTMLPLIAINICTTAYMQSTKRTVSAFVVSMSRQILFLVPCAYTLPLAWGLTGAWLSYPVADGCSIILAVVLLVIAFRKQKNAPDRIAVPTSNGSALYIDVQNESADTACSVELIPDDDNAGLDDRRETSSDSSAPAETAYGLRDRNAALSSTVSDLDFCPGINSGIPENSELAATVSGAISDESTKKFSRTQIESDSDTATDPDIKTQTVEPSKSNRTPADLPAILIEPGKKCGRRKK